MCGISLLLAGPNDSERATLPKIFSKMCKAIRHRGPDLSGLYTSADGVVFAGHERLAVVRPDSGEQPLVNDAGTLVLIINGEIYNYAQLARQFGFDVETLKTDCDIVIKLFEHASIARDFAKVLALLHGDFALCLIDTERRVVYAARDRMGVAPLYAGYGENAIVFSSELKGVVAHPGVTRVEQFPVAHMLTLDFSGGVAPLARSLIAKHAVSLTGLAQTLFDYAPYWRLEVSRDVAASAEWHAQAFEKHVKHVHDTLVAAVHMRVDVCDVPFAVLLSGGLDSSIVAAVAAKHVRESGSAWSTVRGHDHKIHTYAVGMKDSPDLAAARVVANHIGSIHHEFIFTFEKALHALRDVIEAIETYDVTSIRSSVPMTLLVRMIKAGSTKVILSGEGSDEMFAGYLYFHMAPSAQEMQEETVRKLSQLYHYDVLRANKACAMYGTEVRVPFLDQDVLQAVVHDTPPHFKMPTPQAPGAKPIEKYLLRKAFEDYLPSSIAWRQKEQFSDGVGTGWIGRLKEYAESNISDARFAERTMRFPFQTPQTKEGLLYREIFEDLFANSAVSSGRPSCTAVYTAPSVACSSEVALRWCAQGNVVDPSGRSVLSQWKA
jgi:asparagine synthase (glutamine-hydrolysing)